MNRYTQVIPPPPAARRPRGPSPRSLRSLLVPAALLLACAGNRPAAAPGAPPGSAPPQAAATAGKRVLVFTHTTGFRHASIEAAAEAVRTALTAKGWSVEVTADPARLAPAAIAQLNGIVLVSTTGKPLGEQAQEPLGALEAWVRGGGALIGLHAASSTQYDPAWPYTRLVGGKFINHPGSVRPAACHPEGSHPAVAKLPSPFPVRDEIYRFDHLRADNVVILRCDAFESADRLPIAWHRSEGSGRVFYTALGHAAGDYAPESPVWKDHMLPGILWALSR